MTETQELIHGIYMESSLVPNLLGLIQDTDYNDLCDDREEKFCVEEQLVCQTFVEDLSKPRPTVIIGV